MKKTIISALSILTLLFLLLTALNPVYTENDGQIEILHWWLAGREAEAFEKVEAIFKHKHPSLYFTNMAIDIDSGVNALAVLRTRLEAGNPPDTFIVFSGRELSKTWVSRGAMEPLTFIFEQNNLCAAYPADLIDIISHNGDIYTVPMNIRCCNLLWYNKKIFKDNNITPPQTLDEFFSVAQALVKKGIIPLALGESWTQAHLLESVLLAVLDTDGYRGLWNGCTAWDDPRVAKALQLFVNMLEYANDDFIGLHWVYAMDYVIRGNAAMIFMGDWAGVYIQDKYSDFEKQIGLLPAPGTRNKFIMHATSLALPKQAQHKENTVKWLRFCASLECQDTFNSLMGSIPARLDADKSKYDQYQQILIDYYRNSAIVPSVVNGDAANDAWRDDFFAITYVLVAERNTDEAVVEFAAVAKKYLKEAHNR
ncbi:MAG: carbohydrate ABC transporter substrate-binding protein [Spirochaetales bacterium]|nr:carbohydrate ABC transporter substrate-binding protein [Spirochaetales bacterium]